MAMHTFGADVPTVRLADIVGGHRRRRSGRIVPLRSRALINVADVGIMRGHTVNIAEDRITVTLPIMLAAGQQCSIFFALALADHIVAINGKGRVLRCVGDNTHSYSVEMTFNPEDNQSLKALEQLFGVNRGNTVQ